MKVSERIWYFEEPVIGVCPDCGELADYHMTKGLHCPKCGRTDLSIFKWDPNTPHPEGGNQ